MNLLRINFIRDYNSSFQHRSQQMPRGQKPKKCRGKQVNFWRKEKQWISKRQLETGLPQLSHRQENPNGAPDSENIGIMTSP